MKLLRSAFVAVGAFVVFAIVGYMLGNLEIALVAWLVFATVGVYQVCKERSK